MAVKKRPGSGWPLRELSRNVSKRDWDTLIRLRRKLRKSDWMKFASAVPYLPRKSAGAQPLRKMRPILYAILYLLRCATAKATVEGFAKEVRNVVRIDFARSIIVIEPTRHRGPNYKSSKTPSAIAQDIRRGMSCNDRRLWSDLILVIVSWRQKTIDPQFGFYMGGSLHIRFTPLNSARLFKWIDTWLNRDADAKDPLYFRLLAGLSPEERKKIV
jgi:hypothetical protein